MTPSRFPLSARVAAIALLYFAAAKLGLTMAFVAEQITAVWPPTGIALAAVLLGGRSVWPGIWLGAFAANATTADTPIWTAAGIACGNTLEALCGGYLLQRFTDFEPSLRRLRDVVMFGVFGAGLSTMVSATIGVSSLCLSGLQPWARFPELWAVWWLGDGMGALVVAPVVLTWARHIERLNKQRAIEAAVLFTLLVLATTITFGERLAPTIASHPLEFVIFPFVIWAALRFGQIGTATAIFAASTLSILGTGGGSGPFAEGSVHQSLILLQIFMGVLALSGLMLAAAITERKVVERRRSVSYEIAHMLASAESFTEAAPRILSAICQQLGWDVGALWMLDDDRKELHCRELFSRTTERVQDFCDLSRQIRFEPGVGLPGRVWTSGNPLWISDIEHDSSVARADIGLKHGLHGTFAFPIRYRDSVLGVMEFFSLRPQPPDIDLLLTMAAIGSQIGQFIERKRVEEQRRELLDREQAARRDAEAANRAKDEFLATLSHELRTPLNAIVGWTRMLLDGTLDPGSARRALEIVDRNAQAQMNLVGDVLDVSKIITGGLRLDIKPVELGAVIGAALDAIRPAAEAKEIRLRSSLGAGPRVTDGDPSRLQQIAWNLLSNAVKFTDRGGTIEIRVREVDEHTVGIQVRDTGCGIHPSFLPYVFDRFRQGDPSTTREHGGLGLGLAIVRHLTEAHGGTVSAESEGEGRGATFTVRLPISVGSSAGVVASTPAKRTRRTPATVSMRTELSNRRIIVVDDELDARDLIATKLRHFGAQVRSAASAIEALKLIELEWPDLLLADIGMAEMDGYELIRRVRSMEVERRTHLPAVAITAYTRSQDRARAMAEGYDLYLPKPVEPADLVDAAVKLLDASSHSPTR